MSFEAQMNAFNAAAARARRAWLDQALEDLEAAVRAMEDAFAQLDERWPSGKATAVTELETTRGLRNRLRQQRKRPT